MPGSTSIATPGWRRATRSTANTISFSLDENTRIEQATRLVDQAVAELHIPDTLHAEYAGDGQSIGAQPLLILAALIAVYIVLGVLYESLARPLTIISTVVRRCRYALGAATLQNRALAHRLHWHHPFDRHRQEEWKYDGRLCTRRRA